MKPDPKTTITNQTAIIARQGLQNAFDRIMAVKRGHFTEPLFNTANKLNRLQRKSSTRVIEAGYSPYID